MKENTRIKRIDVMVIALAVLVVACPVTALGAQPPYTMNYQGFLTDSSGVPLNGSYNLVFRLYDAVSGGTLDWGPETHNSIQVAKGIFQVVLGSTVTMHPHKVDKAIFLDVQVNGESMTPRQPIHTVAYAFGLVPGAKIQGDPGSTNYALSVNNSGTETTDSGIYARGERYGIYAEEFGDGDVGICTPDFLQAHGIKTTSDSYLWIPGTQAILYPTPNCGLYSEPYGYVYLTCTSSGTRIIEFPISLPGILYGQSVRVEAITIYYDLDHTGSYITHTYLFKTTGAKSGTELVNSSTNRTSTIPTSYTLNLTADNTLDSNSGPLHLRLLIQHDGNGYHNVTIGMIRVRLGHTD